MHWANAPLTVFHGTDLAAARSIYEGMARGRPHGRSDFGAGFYVTTNFHQACQWANRRARRGAASIAAVVEFTLCRDSLESRRHLSFITDRADFYDFVEYCRTGGLNHGPARDRPYEIIYGPVSLWPQKMLLGNGDQIMIYDVESLGGGFRYVRAITPDPPGRKF